MRLADVVGELGGDVRPPHHHLRPAKLGGQGLLRPPPRRVEGTHDLGDITLVHTADRQLNFYCQDAKLIQKLMIDEKKCYLFGRNPQMTDFVVDHGSCSR